VEKDELPWLYPPVHTPSTQTTGVTPHSALIHCKQRIYHYTIQLQWITSALRFVRLLR